MNPTANGWHTEDETPPVDAWCWVSDGKQVRLAQWTTFYGPSNRQTQDWDHVFGRFEDDAGFHGIKRWWMLIGPEPDPPSSPAV